MKAKKKLFNILSSALLTIAASVLVSIPSFYFLGESEIPESLMEE